MPGVPVAVVMLFWNALLVSICATTTATADRTPHCKTVEDCHRAGFCNTTTGECKCAKGFGGDTCEGLQMESFACGDGGLCLANGSTTWGGSVVQADDGSFHMYAAMMVDNLTLTDWLTASVVLHAVSQTGAAGPYIASDIALAPRPEPFFDSVMIHNPDAKRTRDGKYVIFYDGSSKPPSGQAQQDAQLPTGLNPIILRQRIGIATASSPYGPWTRRDLPILQPSNETGTWDQFFVTNPAPYVFPNGSVLLTYKSGRTSTFPGMYEGIAVADSIDGPYRRLTPGNAPLDLPANCEDPGIYFDNQYKIFRMVLHCGCSSQLLWSDDGIGWQTHGPQQTQGWCDNITYANGTIGSVVTRQRPKWVVDAKTGSATHLTTGVNRLGDSGMGHTWTMAAALL